MESGERILVLGLDSAPPRLLYQELSGELENLESIMEYRTTLRSSHPPITIPAWAVMTTGMTPGELGLYGFRHRKPGSYNDVYIANSRMLKVKRVWDEFEGVHRVILQGIPPSYPPQPVKGYLVSDFITPGPEKPYTWPYSLKREIENLVGEYVFDVEFRIKDKDKIKKGLWHMTEVQFKVFKHLISSKKWDFAMIVQIGVDRVHHAFWKYYDTRHPRYPGSNKYEDVIPEYYKLVDKLIGKILEAVPRETRIIVVSDHGAKAMKGAFAVNQWLIEEGYLRLKKNPERPGVDLKSDMVDWDNTLAWGWGGYYARIFLNIKGREPRGVVDPEEAPGLIDELKRKLQAITGPDGESWKTMAYTPHELYPIVNGDAPDLMVYFDDLNWRAAGTLGWPSLYLEENDRGPDDAVHDWIGVAATSWRPDKDPGNPASIERVLYALLSIQRD